MLELLGPKAGQTESLDLKSGRRTAWGHAVLPCTVTGRVDRLKREVVLRFDYITGDDSADPPLYGSQSYSLAEGESALFIHWYDGGSTLWLVSARILSEGTQDEQ